MHNYETNRPSNRPINCAALPFGSVQAQGVNVVLSPNIAVRWSGSRRPDRRPVRAVPESFDLTEGLNGPRYRQASAGVSIWKSIAKPDCPAGSAF